MAYPSSTTKELDPKTARARLGVAVREHRPGVDVLRRDLAAANIAAAIRRETGKGYPITPDHAAALTALLVEVAA